MKKLILLSLLLFLLCSCDSSVIDHGNLGTKDEKTIIEVNNDTFGIAIAKSESADPYTTKNKLNFELMGLICEPLFTVSENFEPSPVLLSPECVTPSFVLLL